MDNVMELARAASSHQYLPPATRETESDTVAASVPESETPNGGPPSKRARKSSVPASASASASASAPAQATAAVPASRRGRKAKPAKQDAPVTSQGDESSTLTQLDASQTEDAAAAAAAAAAAWAQQEHDAQNGDNYNTANMFGPSIEYPNGAPSASAAMEYPSEQQGADQGDDSLFAGTGDQTDAEGAGDTSGADLVRSSGNNRVLSTTKRAAQNRAAQRAFRERRDKRMKDLEETAKHYVTLRNLYWDLQTRYAETLTVNDVLRREIAQVKGEAFDESTLSSGAYAAANNPHLNGTAEIEAPEIDPSLTMPGGEQGLEVVANAAAEAAAAQREAEKQE